MSVRSEKGDNFRSVWPSQAEEERAFVYKAAQDFAANPKMYSTGRIAPGEYIALRWGLGNDCVMVLKLDEAHIPTNYMQLVRRFQAAAESQMEEEA